MNNKRNKRQVIRLNESQLKRVVSEAVKKVLNESCWYGDTKPFIAIYNAASEIMKAFPEISQITLERTLHEMLTKDEVEKIGGGRYTKYRKKE